MRHFELGAQMDDLDAFGDGAGKVAGLRGKRHGNGQKSNSEFHLSQLAQRCRDQCFSPGGISHNAARVKKGWIMPKKQT